MNDFEREYLDINKYINLYFLFNPLYIMKNTRKIQKKSNNNTKKNYDVKKCIDTFVEKKVKYWTSDIHKQIQKLEKKKLSKEEHKILTELKQKRKERIKQLTKQYILYNCNVNCKNTLFEPGLPNQIPKSMCKEYNNNKKLIKIFNNKRKTIFNNKTNVLVDNFYEKTPNKIKNQLIKEGAISNCIPI